MIGSGVPSVGAEQRWDDALTPLDKGTHHIDPEFDFTKPAYFSAGQTTSQ
jgi:hypothetical protein